MKRIGVPLSEKWNIDGGMGLSKFNSTIQCLSPVRGSGIFIEFFHSGFRLEKNPDPGSALKNLGILTIKNCF
jgi:hypothetical protein